MTFNSIYSLKRFLFIAFLFVSTISAIAQNSRIAATALNKLIGGLTSEYYGFGDGQSVSIASTSDGGYIVAGSTQSSKINNVTLINKGGFDFLVVKIAPDGTVQWTKLIGGNKTEYSYAIIQTKDGGYLLGGTSSSSNSGDISATGHGDFDFCLIKLDSSGTVLWSKLFGGVNMEDFRSLKETSDGGFILCGTAGSSKSGDITGTLYGYSDFWVVKVKSDGTMEWNKLIGGTQSDEAYSIQQTVDGGYIMAGFSKSSKTGDFTNTNNGYYDLAIVKLDNSGTVSWNKLYGTAKYEGAFEIQQTTDGGYIVAGVTQSASVPINQPYVDLNGWVMKIDNVGNKTWEKVLSGTKNDVFSGIVQTSDGGFIFSGYSDSNDGDIPKTNHGKLDVWAIKTNASGNIIWNKNYGGTGDDLAFAITKNSSGSFVFAGLSTSSANGDIKDKNNGFADLWLLAIDDNGNIVGSTISQTDLSLKAKSQNQVTEKDTEGTISFTLKNESTIKATNIKVLFKIPYSPPFVIKNSQNCTKGTFDSNMWTVPELAPGDSCVLNLNYSPTQSGVWYVEGEVFSADQEDTDSKANNTIDTEDDFVRACMSIPIKVTTNTFGMQLMIEDTKMIINQWHKDGSAIVGATQSTLQVTSPGKYSYQPQSFKCPTQGCCAFIIQKTDIPSTCCTPLEYILKN